MYKHNDYLCNLDIAEHNTKIFQTFKSFLSVFTFSNKLKTVVENKKISQTEKFKIKPI